MSMGTGAAQSLSLFAIGTAVGLTSIASLSKGKTPPARVFVGGAIAAVMLTGMAEFVPGIVGPLAGVVLITATFVAGGPAYSALSNLVKK